MLRDKDWNIREYKRLRHNIIARNYYKRKRGQKEITLPKIPKRITEASIRKLEEILERTDRRPPTLKQIIKQRLLDIYESVSAGIDYKEWFEEKKIHTMNVMLSFVNRGSEDEINRIKHQWGKISSLLDTFFIIEYQSYKNQPGNSALQNEATTRVWRELMNFITGHEISLSYGSAFIDEETGEIFDYSDDDAIYNAMGELM